MITSGRCHGPGCQRAATGDFCSSECREAWDRALEELATAMGAVTVEEALRNLGAARPALAATGWPVPTEPVQMTLPGAESAQVASEDTQVTHTGQRGWLGRWLHRMRRTRHER